MLDFYSTGDTEPMIFFLKTIEFEKSHYMRSYSDGSPPCIQVKQNLLKQDGGTIKDWQVHDLSISLKVIETQYPGENIKPMIVSGTVVHDSQGRWLPGYQMKSSLVVKIDRENKIFETRNTIYKLSGEEGADILLNLGDGVMKVYYLKQYG